MKADLIKSRYRIDPDIEIGIMIETPSAVAMAGALAKEVDFFSIGTNDLVQYTMAVDRGNAKIAHLYQHLHPSIIRFLKMTVDAAKKNDIPTAVCGEMCADPLATVILLGLGIDEFSCSPNAMPEIKSITAEITLPDWFNPDQKERTYTEDISDFTLEVLPDSKVKLTIESSVDLQKAEMTNPDGSKSPVTRKRK